MVPTCAWGAKNVNDLFAERQKTEQAKNMQQQMRQQQEKNVLNNSPTGIPNIQECCGLLAGKKSGCLEKIAFVNLFSTYSNSWVSPQDRIFKRNQHIKETLQRASVTQKTDEQEETADCLRLIKLVRYYQFDKMSGQSLSQAEKEQYNHIFGLLHARIKKHVMAKYGVGDDLCLMLNHNAITLDEKFVLCLSAQKTTNQQEQAACYTVYRHYFNVWFAGALGCAA
jgi:hypothetical protein